MLSTHVIKYPSVFNFARKYAINKLLCKFILVFIHRLEEDYAKELEIHYRFIRYHNVNLIVYYRGESLIERQAKMRQRAKELADKREQERLKIVTEKNEQKWRQECVGEL